MEQRGDVGDHLQPVGELADREEGPRRTRTGGSSPKRNKVERPPRSPESSGERRARWPECHPGEHRRSDRQEGRAQRRAPRRPTATTANTQDEGETSEPQISVPHMMSVGAIAVW